MSLSRRDLLRYFSSAAGCFVVYAATAPLVGCTEPNPLGEATGDKAKFPHGVASADPQSDAVVLWTRIDGESGSVPLTVQVAADNAFGEIIAEQTVEASPDWDHTVRVLVADLASDSFFFYRFLTPDGAVSRTGRTRTAPEAGAMKPLNVAVFSCQDYEQGYFTAYRRLILDDRSASEDTKIDMIMHVGDFIYEHIRGPETKAEVDLNGNQIELYNADGSLRRVPPFPSGGTNGSRGWITPKNLDDFRHLYKTYLTDPDLQEAKALYPFVQTWDDHELVNDYWQSYHKGKSIADLKLASNKAWFEFIPAALSMGGRDMPDHRATDFIDADVANTPPANFDDDYFAQEENNKKAVGSLTIYRSLKWGAMAELFMVDGRSYRGPRGLPQELLTIGRHPYPEGPIKPELIETMNAGRNANGGNPPEQVTYLDQVIDNPRKDAPTASMLGAAQKEWLKSGLTRSNAKWKLLGLNVGLLRHGFDSSFREGGGKNRILWTDGWDGYPVERRELTQFVANEGLSNVVVLTGDRHAHMAGSVVDDYEAETPRPLIPEFAGGATSAPSRLTIQDVLTKHDPELHALCVFDGEPFDIPQKIMPSLNAWMVHGSAAAQNIHDTGSDAKTSELSDPDVNPYLDYVDSDGFGYFVARFDDEGCRTDFVCIQEPVDSDELEEPSERRRVSFEVASWAGGAAPELRLTNVDGPRPIGGLK